MDPGKRWNSDKDNLGYRKTGQKAKAQPSGLQDGNRRSRRTHCVGGSSQSKTFDDLKCLIHRSGKFRLETIYDENHNQIPLNAHISGEMGNLYYVLKVL
jgi:hypothetical protein